MGPMANARCRQRIIGMVDDVFLTTAHEPNWFIFGRWLKFSGAARRQIDNVLCPLVQVARTLVNMPVNSPSVNPLTPHGPSAGTSKLRIRRPGRASPPCLQNCTMRAAGP